MKRRTKELFADTPYGVPLQKRGHVPEILERAHSNVLHCSCGWRSPRCTFGNRAGWAYGIVALFFHYVKHVGRLQKSEAAVSGRVK